MDALLQQFGTSNFWIGSVAVNLVCGLIAAWLFVRLGALRVRWSSWLAKRSKWRHARIARDINLLTVRPSLIPIYLAVEMRLRMAALTIVAILLAVVTYVTFRKAYPASGVTFPPSDYVEAVVGLFGLLAASTAGASVVVADMRAAVVDQVYKRIAREAQEGELALLDSRQSERSPR